jgi:2,5-diketo-D-gluconate reductase B
VEESLKRLRLNAVDLLLLHWPNPDIPLAESMRALSTAKRAGLTRSIGVSNFVIAKLEEAIKVSPEPIAAAQFEYHPYLEQSRLLAAVRRHGLAIIAYCPIALGRAANDPRLAAIGRKHDKSAVQAALRWLVQQEDTIAIPKTSKPDRLKENLSIFDFRLTDEEMDQIGRMAAPNSRLINEPQWVPYWD